MATTLALNTRTRIASSNYSSYSQMHLRTYATVTSQSGNSSTVKFEVATWADYSGYASANTSFKCDGTTKTISGTYSWQTSESVVMTKTITIAHDSDGTKTYNGATSSSTAVLGSASQTWSIVLPTIVSDLTAPTTFTIDAGYGSTVLPNETITMAWSGATGTIAGYEIQWTRDGSEWKTGSKWNPFTGGTTTTDSFSAEFPIGAKVQYRVRAVNGSAYSEWKESNVLRIAGSVDMKVNGEWTVGAPYVKENGEWHKAKRVWIKVNGIWKTS